MLAMKKKAMEAKKTMVQEAEQEAEQDMADRRGCCITSHWMLSCLQCMWMQQERARRTNI
jgi:hypothetical protein